MIKDETGFTSIVRRGAPRIVVPAAGESAARATDATPYFAGAGCAAFGRLRGAEMPARPLPNEAACLVAYADGTGACGALLFYPQRIRNYRDWYHVDEDVWTHYWFAMVNRGVLAQPYWWDEQWTVSVQHTERDIAQHLQAFAEIAPALAVAQQERSAVGAHSA